MPSHSPAQAKLMRAVAHNPEFARKVDIPQSVGKEFASADQRKATAKALRGDRNKGDDSSTNSAAIGGGAGSAAGGG